MLLCSENNWVKSDSAFAPLCIHSRPSEVTGLSPEGNARLLCTESLTEGDVKCLLSFFFFLIIFQILETKILEKNKNK